MGTKRDKKKKKRDPTVSAKNKLKKKEEEENVEELIEEFNNSIKESVGIFPCKVPSRRANASIVSDQAQNIYFFGGEFYDGRKTFMYNDFYSYSIDKNEWKKICTLESPGPRSSQQMVIFPNGTIYLL